MEEDEDDDGMHRQVSVKSLVLISTRLNIVAIPRGKVTRMGERRGVYRVLVGRPEGKRPLGRPRCRWEDNIRMDFQEVECGGMDWFRIGTGGGHL